MPDSLCQGVCKSDVEPDLYKLEETDHYSLEACTCIGNRNVHVPQWQNTYQMLYNSAVSKGLKSNMPPAFRAFWLVHFGTSLFEMTSPN
jgi:hypothetical protein